MSFFVGSGGMSVLGATFQAACFRAHGDNAGELVAVLPVEHDGRDNAVLLTVPELEGGHYDWELRATGEDGGECRLLYGTLSVLSSADFEHVVEAAEAASLRELAVQIGGGYAAPLVLRWQACHATVAAAAQAARSAEAAAVARAAAESAAESALARLSAAQAFMGSFNEALRQAVTVVDDYLYIGGVNTGHRLRGEDGVTPHIGADGYWYRGEERLVSATGEAGVTPGISPTGYWVIGDIVTTARAIGKDGLDGTVVRRVLIGSVEELPAGEERGVLYYVKIGEKLYDVYAWLERGGWTNVKETYDIATSDIYGLCKLATDVVHEVAAPVAANSQGQMVVPPATSIMCGTGKLGTSFVVDSATSAPVGLGANKEFRVPRATFGTPGVLELSHAANDCANCLGLTPTGTGGVSYATKSSAGVFRLGAEQAMSNPAPYSVGVGSNEKKELSANFVFGGALQCRTGSAWQGVMPWLDEVMEAYPGYFGDGQLAAAFYSGLVHSEQFTQTLNGGLTLCSASSSLLAGVYLAESMEDTRVDAVPTAAMVVEYLGEHFGSGDDVYKREETYSKEQVDAIDKKIRQDAAEVYKTVEDAHSEHEALSERIDGCVRRSDSVEEFCVLSMSEYQALQVRNPKCLYLITEE